MIKILVADDHAIVRRGLKEIVSREKDIEIVGEAQSGAEVLEKARKLDPDIVVLDYSMPGRSGLEILRGLRTEHRSLRVLMLSMHPEDQLAVRALKAGAAGYLSKEGAPEELVRAIRKIASGGKYISPALAERLAFDLESDTQKPPHELLSDREYQVLCLIASGKSVSHVAEELSLSVKTISTYRARILEKMQMKNNAELTHYAIRMGLVR